MRCVYTGIYVFICTRGWSSKDTFQQSILSSHHVDPRDGTHVTRLGSKFLYLLRHLEGSSPIFYYKKPHPAGSHISKNFSSWVRGIKKAKGESQSSHVDVESVNSWL